MSPAACKDPIMISKIDEIIKSVRERVENNFEKYGIKDFFLDFKIYGKKGVMAMFEACRRITL